MITFTDSNPEQLLASIRDAIWNGHVETWTEIDGYFTHTPTQWARRAWLKPSIAGNELRFSIVNSEGLNVSVEVYAVYHGRFIEMMLAHFDKRFSGGVATALAITPDQVAA